VDHHPQNWTRDLAGFGGSFLLVVLVLYQCCEDVLRISRPTNVINGGSNAQKRGRSEAATLGESGGVVSAAVYPQLFIQESSQSVVRGGGGSR
jgi:hypothetical protein